MRSRIFLLALSLAVVFGGASALADEHDDDTTGPEANTVFVATATLEAETTFIKYHVCSLNNDDEVVAADCQAVLDNFDDEAFDWTTFEGFEEIVVEPNGEGEINHGSYVSAFAQGFDGPGKGCLVRYIAQSNWGKEGFDIEGDDVLIQAQTFCAFNSDKPADGDDDGNGKPAWAGQGKPPWAGPDGDKSLKPGKGGNDD